MQAPLYDLSPLPLLLLVGLLVASGPLLWVGLRNRRATPLGRLKALTWVTLFLTFDLVMFGAFTRLTDSGLGCPDWPGCYASASPLGAHEEIAAAQSAQPSGPVTHSKAWVEMLHRYFATGVGALIVVLTFLSWRAVYGAGRLGHRISPWWATSTLVWVCIQGAFGALTVTMKLFPAIVSLHLLGGYVLLALLTVQLVLLALLQGTGQGGMASATVSTPIKVSIALAFAMLVVQALSGAWVSTNYAVLACTDFPQCHGGWWPAMDFRGGFSIWRPLGMDAQGGYISVQALTAIHFAHRVLALLTTVVLASLAWHLRRTVALRKPANVLAGLLALQLITGLSNVVLGWPIVAAVMHTAGAGALVVTLTWLLTLALAPQPTNPPARFSE